MPQRHPQGRAPLLPLHGHRDPDGEQLTDLSDIRVARFDELSTRTLFQILLLRQEVFIVEQNCAYPDMDMSDLEPTTHHLWIEAGDSVVSSLRLIRDDNGASRIGRVVTAKSHRQRGLAGRLLNRAIELAEPPVVLNAQAHLEGWYQLFGFVTNGPGWVEAGIDHIPMLLVPV